MNSSHSPSVQKGNLLKMKTRWETPVSYTLPLGEFQIPLNPLIGKEVTLHFNGTINDIYDQQPIKKSYGQGFSYKNFMTLARCDSCIIKPELCHYHQGSCREPQWGEAHCFEPHYIYLANTSGLKVGITRQTQIPTRWIDQGASCALPILKVPDRLTSGLVEVELKKQMNDKTNWRKMLQGQGEEIDLYEERENIFETFGDVLDDLKAQDLDEDTVKISYPMEGPAPSLRSLDFHKTPTVSGTLLGIKGQYLIFDNGVLNIRKYQGYFIEFRAGEIK